MQTTERDYIFVSYKGEDAAALAFIRRLQDAGFRLWYDARLLGADEWARVIADRIQNCGYFLSLVTEEFLGSPWCEKEILTAHRSGLPVLAVFLTNAPLPRKLRPLYEDIPTLERANYADDEAFFEALCVVDGLSDFCMTPVLPGQILLTLEVKRLGTTEWHQQIKAACGETARWRVHFVQTDDLLRENFSLRCILPSGLQLVPGTTTIFNNAHPEGVTLSDRLCEDSGINLGDYAPGGGAWLYFNTVVAQQPVQNTIFRNILQASFGRDSGTVEASADVIVEA